jgi:hypothetical protein
MQAAQLLCSFREYHRRASFGLSGYYGQKLAAFEDVLLNAREALFGAQQGPEQLQEDQQLKVRRAHTTVQCVLTNERLLFSASQARSPQVAGESRPCCSQLFTTSDCQSSARLL